MEWELLQEVNKRKNVASHLCEELRKTENDRRMCGGGISKDKGLVCRPQLKISDTHRMAFVSFLTSIVCQYWRIGMLTVFFFFFFVFVFSVLFGKSITFKLY